MFNPHNNVTADGVVITEGLRVFTNNLDVGEVISDSTSTCCLEPTDDPELLDHRRTSCPKGQQRIGNTYFTDHQATTEYPHTACRHDHWFDVMLDNDGGTVMMNGERMATVFEGRRA